MISAASLHELKICPTVIAARDYVIQTTLDFGARFPGHRGADTNPAEVRHQPLFSTILLDTRVLSNK
jgi:hypothetical protein